jgi:hypothetical protein
MIDLAAAYRGIAGALRLARLDPNAIHDFDDSIEGFWKSFQAAVIAAPLFALLILLRTAEHPLSPDPLRAVVIEAIGYVIGWTAFPLAAWYLANALGRSGRYLAYIVAYNWANVLQVSAFVPVAALSALGVAPQGIMVFAALLLTGLIIYYQFFIVRTALAVEPLPALGFVAVDLILGLLINGVETALHAS